MKKLLVSVSLLCSVFMGACGNESVETIAPEQTQEEVKVVINENLANAVSKVNTAIRVNTDFTRGTITDVLFDLTHNGDLYGDDSILLRSALESYVNFTKGDAESIDDAIDSAIALNSIYQTETTGSLVAALKSASINVDLYVPEPEVEVTPEPEADVESEGGWNQAGDTNTPVYDEYGVQIIDPEITDTDGYFEEDTTEVGVALDTYRELVTRLSHDPSLLNSESYMYELYDFGEPLIVITSNMVGETGYDANGFRYDLASIGASAVSFSRYIESGDVEDLENAIELIFESNYENDMCAKTGFIGVILEDVLNGNIVAE